MALDELGLFDDAFKSANGRIKSFQMANLKDPLLRLREIYEISGFGDIRG